MQRRFSVSTAILVVLLLGVLYAVGRVVNPPAKSGATMTMTMRMQPAAQQTPPPTAKAQPPLTPAVRPSHSAPARPACQDAGRGCRPSDAMYKQKMMAMAGEG